MGKLTIPLDSLAVVPAIVPDAESATWSEAFAAGIAEFFAGSDELRVVPASRASSWASLDLSPEEIGRRLNVRCVVVCEAAVSGDDADVRVEAIDVLAESTICATSLLTAAGEAVRAQRQVACWLSSCCLGKRELIDHPTMREDVYARVLRARTLQRKGRIAEAIASLRECASIDLAACDVFANVVVDAPADAIDEGIVEDVVRVVPHVTSLTAARVHFRFTGDFEAAGLAFGRATRGSCDPAAHAHCGIFLIAMRRLDEAERELRCARELSEPFMPERMLVELGMQVLCGERPLDRTLEQLHVR
jgi:hypothetical protein